MATIRTLPGVTLPAPEPVKKRGPGQGRPPLAPAETLETFYTAIRAGNRLQAAARYAGLSVGSVEAWMARGQGRAKRPPTPRYVEFSERVERARAEAEVFAVAQVRRGMVDSPSAAIWFLRNTSPEWRQDAMPVAPPPPVNVNAQVNVAPGVVVLSREVLEAAARMQVAANRDEDDEHRKAARARLVSDSADD